MRHLDPAVLIMLCALVALPLAADPPSEAPAPAVEVEAPAAADEAVVAPQVPADACDSAEASIFGEPAPLLPTVDVAAGEEPGAGRACLCRDNCCTGCPGICCARGMSEGGACAAVKSCYRLDCPF